MPSTLESGPKSLCYVYVLLPGHEGRPDGPPHVFAGNKSHYQTLQFETTRFLGGGDGGRETGNSGGSLEAIFSPLGVPTLVREVIDRVSIPNSLIKHEELKKKRISALKKCCTVDLDSSSAHETDLNQN